MSIKREVFSYACGALAIGIGVLTDEYTGSNALAIAVMTLFNFTVYVPVMMLIGLTPKDSQ